MKISIIIPVYNLEEYIIETLKSIENQTFRNFECIIINDGSTDQTKTMIENYINNKKRYRLITTKNKGVSAARNEGLSHIDGEYVYFVDGDDLIPWNALELLVQAALKHEADIVIGKMMHQRGNTLHEISTYKKYGVNTEGVKNLEANPEILHSIGPTAKLFRTKVIGEYRFPVGRKFAEEHAFVVNAFLNSAKIYGIQQLVYNYVVRDKGNESATQSLSENAAEYVRNLISTHREVYMLMKDKVSNQTMQYYYFRITEYIMWPLIKSVCLNRNKLNKVNSALVPYFSEEFHLQTKCSKTFKNVYINYYIMQTPYDIFCNQTNYIEYFRMHSDELTFFERQVFNKNTKIWFQLYKYNMKAKNVLKRLYGKLFK